MKSWSRWKRWIPQPAQTGVFTDESSPVLASEPSDAGCAGAPMAKACSSNSLGVSPPRDQGPHAFPANPVQPCIRCPVRLGHLLRPKALLLALQPGHCPMRTLCHRVVVATCGESLLQGYVALLSYVLPLAWHNTLLRIYLHISTALGKCACIPPKRILCCFVKLEVEALSQARLSALLHVPTGLCSTQTPGLGAS